MSRVIKTFLYILMILSFVWTTNIQAVDKIYGGFVVKPSGYVLTVIFVFVGAGASGTVVSVPGGISCSATCSHEFPSGEVVTLTATPGGTSTFTGWSGSGCAGVGTCVVTMDANKEVTATFTAGFTPPKGDYLIAWYKCSEGSGNTVTNYATDGSLGGGLLPSMSVYNSSGDFWTFDSGFCATPSGTALAIKEYAYATYTARNLGDPTAITWGVFFKKKVSPSWNRNTNYVTNIGTTGGASKDFGTSTFYPNAGNKDTNWYATMDWGVSSSNTTYGNHSTGNWYFAFLGDDEYLYVVKPDGTKIKGDAALPGGALSCTFVLGGVSIGTGAADGDYGCECSWADFIVYNSTQLTDAQWGSWYDELRSRYGMSARSGW